MAKYTAAEIFIAGQINERKKIQRLKKQNARQNKERFYSLSFTCRRLYYFGPQEFNRKERREMRPGK